MSKADRYAKMFVPGALKLRTPKDRRPFKAPRSFQGPKELILSGYCTPVENQGSKPWCAAYSASSYAENLRWRLDGYHRDIDPAPIYAHAKTIDGDPDGDGTYLECALKGLLARKVFDPDVCKVRTFGSSWFSDSINDLKYAIHRYGVCVAGFMITSEWFNPKGGVIRGLKAEQQGGHAVTVCGYDDKGVLILNSWGPEYGKGGFVYLTNEAFLGQFMYGALLTRVLDGLT